MVFLPVYSCSLLNSQGLYSDPKTVSLLTRHSQSLLTVVLGYVLRQYLHMETGSQKKMVGCSQA